MYGNFHLGDQEGLVRLIYKPFENRLQVSKMEGTDSRSCLVAGYGISVKSFVSARVGFHLLARTFLVIRPKKSKLTSPW